jgi:hypothetical protein
MKAVCVEIPPPSASVSDITQTLMELRLIVIAYLNQDLQGQGQGQSTFQSR